MVLLTQDIADLKSEKENYLWETKTKEFIISEMMHDLLTLRRFIVSTRKRDEIEK